MTSLQQMLSHAKGLIFDCDGTLVGSSTPHSDAYDFSPSRAGEHARNLLGTWNGKLVCDDFAVYKASFDLGITKIGCMAHARRKFFDLHVANRSQLAEQALHSIGGLYEVER